MPKNNIIVELFYNGVWNNITDEEEVFTDTPIIINQGTPNEYGGLRPASISLRLNNNKDKYRVSNPLSPLYRLVGRNTPLRVTVNDSIRGVAEVDTWACSEKEGFRLDPPRGKAWTDVLGFGILGRVNKWKRFIRSTLYRASILDSSFAVEYWDMEVPSGGLVAPSAIGGSPLKAITAVRYTLPDGSVLAPGGAPDFGRGTGIKGSAPLPNFQGGGTLAGPIRDDTFDGYAIDWVMKFEANTDEGGTTSCDVLRWRESGTYVTFTVNVTKDFVTVFHSNKADALTLTATGSATAAIDMYTGSPHHFRYQVRQSGGNYLAQLYVDSGLYATADNFVPGMAGTVGKPTYVEWNPLEDRGDFMPTDAGHLEVWRSGQVGQQPPVFYALNGYSTDTTGERLNAILDEEAIPHSILGTSRTEMGPQRPDTLINHFKEVKNTEDSLVYDAIDDLEVVLKNLDDRYNQVPVLTLYPSDFTVIPTETIDNLDIMNVVTVRQREGSEAVAEDSTSFLGTQAPPDGVGEEKSDIDVNLYDPVTYLDQWANWYLRRGTVDLPRYAQIVIDLNANPSIDISNLAVGKVVEILTLRENTIRVFVLAWTEEIRTHAHKLSLVCKPDQQFVVGVYDSTNSRYDLRSSTLNGVHSKTATTLNFSITQDEAWSSTSSYDLFISGERVTIPVGGMAARDGSPGAYTQVATGVIRAVNGIHKVLPASSEVHVATPGRYAL